MTAGAGHLDEQALSEVVDGLAPPETHAHLDGCSDCRALVQRWRQVAATVAALPAPLPPEAREAALAAARRAWAVPVTAVRRRRRRRTAAVWLAAAAAAAAIVAVSLSLSGHPSRPAATGAAPSSGASSPRAGGPAVPALSPGPGSATAGSATAGPNGGGADEGSPPAGQRTGQASEAPGPAPAPALGSIASPAALVSAVRPLVAGGRGGGATNLGCLDAAAPPASAAGVTSGSPQVASSLVYEGTPAVVYVYARGAGDVAVVLARSSCAVLASVPF